MRGRDRRTRRRRKRADEFYLPGKAVIAKVDQQKKYKND
jgi:hypothetical protein